MRQRLIQSMSWQRVRGRRLAKQHFHEKNLQQLGIQIAASEQGHSGEIVVAIEAVSPIHETDSYLRALEVFGRLEVWDTPQNTGVLLYVALDRRRIELIADRGISAQADSWQQICDDLQQSFKAQNYFSGVMAAVQQLEEVLRAHTPPEGPDHKDANHLDNRPVVLS